MMTDPIFAITLEASMVQWEDIDHAMEASSIKKNITMGARMAGSMLLTAIKSALRAIGGLFLRFGTFVIRKIREFRDRKKIKAEKAAAKAKAPARNAEDGLYRNNSENVMTEEEAKDFKDALSEARDLLDGVFKNKFMSELTRFSQNPVSYARNHLGNESALKEAQHAADDQRRDFNAAMSEVSRAALKTGKTPPPSTYREIEAMGHKIQEVGKYALEQAKAFENISSPPKDDYFSDEKVDEINDFINMVQQEAKWYFKGFTGTCNDCYQRMLSILKDMDAAFKREDSQAA